MTSQPPSTTIDRPLIKTVSIDHEGLTLFIGPLEAAIMRAVWNNANTSRAIYRAVRDEYRPEKSEEIAFTSVTSTIDRLFERGFLTRTGDRSGYTYAPAVPDEEAFASLCVSYVLKALIDWYPREVIKIIRQHIASKGSNNGK
jgi:predicted transcriptional regulator